TRFTQTHTHTHTHARTPPPAMDGRWWDAERGHEEELRAAAERWQATCTSLLERHEAAAAQRHLETMAASRELVEAINRLGAVSAAAAIAAVATAAVVLPWLFRRGRALVRWLGRKQRAEEEKKRREEEEKQEKEMKEKEKQEKEKQEKEDWERVRLLRGNIATTKRCITSTRTLAATTLAAKTLAATTLAATTLAATTLAATTLAASNLAARSIWEQVKAVSIVKRPKEDIWTSFKKVLPARSNERNMIPSNASIETFERNWLSSKGSIEMNWLPPTSSIKRNWLPSESSMKRNWRLTTGYIGIERIWLTRTGIYLEKLAAADWQRPEFLSTTAKAKITMAADGMAAARQDSSLSLAVTVLMVLLGLVYWLRRRLPLRRKANRLMHGTRKKAN
ncbi:hypothetical protein B0T24DRAFT_698185, partial [Lasiosphaeria ovina]